jgi:hypothetical protein
MRNDKLTVVPTKPPAKIGGRTYADFDEMIRVIDMLDLHWQRLNKCSEELSEVIGTIQETLENKPPLTPSQKQIDDASLWVLAAKSAVTQSTLDDGQRMVDLGTIAAKMRADVAFYERDELWEDRDHGVISRELVSDAIGILVGSYPNTNPHSPKVYTAMLIEEAIAAKPNPIIFEAACRRWRRTEKFAPSPSEFLKVMAKISSEWGERDRWSVTETHDDGVQPIENLIKNDRLSLAEDIEVAEALLTSIEEKRAEATKRERTRCAPS